MPNQISHLTKQTADKSFIFFQDFGSLTIQHSCYGTVAGYNAAVEACKAGFLEAIKSNPEKKPQVTAHGPPVFVFNVFVCGVVSVRDFRQKSLNMVSGCLQHVLFFLNVFFLYILFILVSMILVHMFQEPHEPQIEPLRFHVERSAGAAAWN